MSEYEIEKDDYKSLETIHSSPPNPREVAQNHEISNELNKGVEGRKPLEWTEEEYNPSELEKIVEEFRSDLNAPLRHWRLEIDSNIGQDVLDVVPITHITGVLNYEFEAKGYGTAESDLEIIFEYDESRPHTEIHTKLGGEMEFEFPDHITDSDKAAMERDIEEDLLIARKQISETIEDIPQLEL